MAPGVESQALFDIYPRLAANLEAAVLWIITLLVWVPRQPVCCDAA